MSSKYIFGFRSFFWSSRTPIFCLLLTAYCLLLTINSFSETIDRIVAVVNEKVITLTDLRVGESFGLYDKEISERSENPRLLILEMLINQKVVIPLASEDITVEEKELDSFYQRIIGKIGKGKVKNKLEEFGLNQGDLREYFQEKILYQKIIARKFSPGIIVNLEEIEVYYNQTYLPSQKEKGMEPQPMIEILDEIETIIKQEKIKSQVEEWLRNLKRKAEIYIKLYE